MGRLEDIAARNKQAMRGDNLIVKAIGRGGDKSAERRTRSSAEGDAKVDDKSAEPAGAFTLPSQRKSGTPVWKVLALMALLGTAIGIYACRQVERDQQDVERRIHGG